MKKDLKQLESIISDTELLLSMAEAGDWDAMCALEIRRAEQLEQLFATPPRIEPAILAEKIKYILHKNEIIMQLSNEEKNNVATEVTKLSRGNKAVNAYLS